MKYQTDWRPFSLCHGRDEALDAYAFLVEQIGQAEVRGGGEIAERIYRPQLEKVMSDWNITYPEITGWTCSATSRFLWQVKSEVESRMILAAVFNHHLWLFLLGRLRHILYLLLVAGENREEQ